LNTHLTALLQDNLGESAPEGKTILEFNETKDDGVAVAAELITTNSRVFCPSLGRN